MTAIRPSKVIRFENYGIDKRSPIHHSVRPANYRPLRPKSNSNKSYPVYDLGKRAEFEQQLLAFEKIARYQYSKILESLTFKEIPKWFDQMLDYCLLPALQKIGFDDPISKVLFKIAPSSWNLMGPLNEKVVAFHPVINQQVKDVRHGLKLNAGKKNEMFQFTVEFFGNFSLKFAERHHPPDQLTKLLFYGYSALFWKNLRCPPENLENRAVFEYFFRWLCNLRSKKDFLGKEERRAVRCMIKMKKMAFPGKNFNRPQIRGKPDISPFIITLRHGYIGIATILKYFGIDQFLDSRQTGKRFACPSVQNEVQSLLNIIQTKFHLESKQTKENIKLFINCLRSAYSQMQTSFHPSMNKFLNIKFNNLQISLDT